MSQAILFYASMVKTNISKLLILNPKYPKHNDEHNKKNRKLLQRDSNNTSKAPIIVERCCIYIVLVLICRKRLMLQLWC